MKYLLTLIVAIFLFQNAYCNYKQYQNDIINAEHLFISYKYDSALVLYKKIFDNKDYNVFCKDIFIAMQIATLKNDTINFEYFTNLAFQKGLNIKALTFSKPISNFIKLHFSLYNKLIAGYSILRNEYIKNLNLEQRYQITSLVIIDGFYHELPNKVITETACDTLFDIMAYKNTNELLGVCKKNGYPNEFTIGFSDNDFLSKDFSTFGLYDNYVAFETFPILVFFHCKYAFPLLKPYLLSALEKGFLNPREYALILEWSRHKYHSENNAYIKAQINEDSSTAVYDILPLIFGYRLQATRKEINRNRKKIGMCSLEHDEDKKQFAKDNNLNLYFGRFKNL